MSGVVLCCSIGLGIADLPRSEFCVGVVLIKVSLFLEFAAALLLLPLLTLLSFRLPEISDPSRWRDVLARGNSIASAREVDLGDEGGDSGHGDGRELLEPWSFEIVVGSKSSE